MSARLGMDGLEELGAVPDGLEVLGTVILQPIHELGAVPRLDLVPGALAWVERVEPWTLCREHQVEGEMLYSVGREEVLAEEEGVD